MCSLVRTIASVIYYPISLCRAKRPAPPLIPSNEAIQARLQNLDSHAVKATSAFWDTFHSIKEGPPSDTLTTHFQENRKESHAFDLGSGKGANTRFLLSRGWQVTAVDISEPAVKSLSTVSHSSLTVTLSHIEDFSFTRRANLIIAIDVLAFCLPSKIYTLWNRMHAALNDSGYLLCTLPVPHGGGSSNWSLTDDESSQLLLAGRFRVLQKQDFSEDPYTDHPLLLLLQKI